MRGKKLISMILAILMCVMLPVGALADEGQSAAEDGVPVSAPAGDEAEITSSRDAQEDDPAPADTEEPAPADTEQAEPEEDDPSQEQDADVADEIAVPEEEESSEIDADASAEPIAEEDAEPLEIDGEGEPLQGSCGDSANWALVKIGGTDEAPEYRLEITGSGAMASYVWDGAAGAGQTPWADQRAAITEISVSGVSSIGNYAFAGCSAAASVSLAESVTALGVFAFYNCSGLASVALPSGLTSIGGCAFYKCSGLSGSIEIPAGVTVIPYSAFEDCRGITSVTIPEGVRSIATCAFDNCVSLTSAALPSTVTYVGSMAFYNCSSLGGTVSLPSAQTIGSSAFAHCSSLTGVQLGDSITSIGDHAFSDCVRLSGTVTIPSGVTRIGKGVFRGCSSLRGATLPNGVTSIGEEAFAGCIRMTQISIPASVQSIDRAAFEHCSSLTAFAIPAGVVTISESVFQNCTRLNTVTIPAGVTEIQANAFHGCTSLSAADIPSGVTSIGEGAFQNCRLLSAQLPSGLTTLGASAFEGAGLQEVTIPNGIATVPTAAFRNCEQLIGVSFHANTETVRQSAFSGCNALAAVNYAKTYDDWNGVTIEEDNDPLLIKVRYAEGDVAESGKCGDNASYTIDRAGALTITGAGEIRADAFKNRTDITSVSISEGITSVGANAFSGCTAIGNVAYASSKENWDTISIASGNAPLLDAKITYAEGDILYTEKCGPSAYYSMSKTGDAVVTGSGAISDGFFRNNTDIKTLEIQKNVSSVGANAFAGCTELETVKIADSVTQIGQNAFSGCTAIEEITVDGTQLNWSAASIASGNDVITGAKTYYTQGNIKESGHCGEGTTYTISTDNTLTITGSAVDAAAFKDYGEFRSVVVPTSVTSIGENAFSGCSIGSVTYKGMADTWHALWDDGSFAETGNSALKNAKLYASDGTGDFSWKQTSNGRIAITGTGELGLMDWEDLTGKIVLLDNRTTGLTRQATGSLQDATAILIVPTGDYDGYAELLQQMHDLGLTQTRVLGDGDGDGNILACDISRAMRYADGGLDLDAVTGFALDVDGNGTIARSDVIAMGRYIVGQITRFPGT